MPEPAPKTHGTWVKYTDDGRLIERVAYSPADAVRFRYDGFEKQEPLPEIRRPHVEPPARPAKATKARPSSEALLLPSDSNPT